MNDKLRQWIEAEIERLQQVVKRFQDYSNLAIQDMVATASAQEAALQSVLQKDKEITKERFNLNNIEKDEFDPVLTEDETDQPITPITREKHFKLGEVEPGKFKGE